MQPFTPVPSHPHHKKIMYGFIGAIVIIAGLILTIILVGQQQEIRQRASGPSCSAANGASCSWSPSDGATSYHYKIVNVGTGQTVAEGDTSSPSASFTSVPGQTYTCVVTASNACGTAPQAEGTSTCQITQTPTPTGTVTPTPTLTPTVTTTPTPTPLSCNSSCSTSSDCAGITGSNQTPLSCINGFCRNPSCSSDATCFCGSPTPTQTLTPTQTPTQTLTPTESVTPSQTQTPTPTQSITPTNTLTPTLSVTPPPGSTATPSVTQTPTPTLGVFAANTPTPTLTPILPPTGPGDTFVNIGLIGVEVFLVGALIVFAF